LKRILMFVVCVILTLSVTSVSVNAEEAQSAMSSLKVRIASESITGDLFTTYETAETLKEDIPASAESLNVNAKSAVLMEVSTGKVLFEQNKDDKLAPASITKIMSLLLIVEAIETGKITKEETVAASATAASMGGSQIWLEEGETMTVHELLKATAVASANDACVALAEHVAGSVEEFVSMMNDRAAELGMKNTVFVNCTGLDAEGHLTTAYDVAVMSRELIKHEMIKEYTQIWIDYLRNGETQLVNTNKLARFYDGTTGLKTGTTSQAGYCLSATAEKNGMELVAVVMSGSTSNERFNGAKKMLNYGFANWSVTVPRIDASLIRPVKVKGGKEDSVETVAENIKPVILKKGEEKEIACEVKLCEEINAPVKKGDVLGSVTIKLGSSIIGNYKITATQSVNKLTLGTVLLRLMKSLVGL